MLKYFLNILCAGLLCYFSPLLHAQQGVGGQPLTEKVKDTRDEKDDSLLYTGIKQRLYKSKIGKGIYGLLFKDVYNSAAKGQVSKIALNPFLEYEGYIIRSIKVKSLNVFGHSVYDTTRRPRNVVEKLGNKVHVITKERIIRNSFITFAESDAIDAEKFKNNERLLRQQQFLHDARIYIDPVPGKKNLADVTVVVHDNWALSPVLNYSSSQRFGIELHHNNFGGQAHEVVAGYFTDDRIPLQKNNFYASYTIPYIKKSLITAQSNLFYTGEEKSLNLKLFRPFLTPEIKYAGAAELGYFKNQIRDKVRGLDSTFYYPVSNYLTDLWLGRAFPLFFGDKDFKKQSRIILAARARKYTFTQRPALSADSNQTYQNRRSYLFNIGFSNRTYRRDVLIYGFGRTEDVPEGYLGSLVLGRDNAELGLRNYYGIKMAKGRYLYHNKGYLYSVVNLGSYVKNKTLEQGILSYQGYYYSPLISWKLSKIRQFVNFNFTQGLNRFNTVEERLNLSDDGIRGVRSDSLQGIKKLVVNFETVLFSRASLAGFRIAPYVFADFGLVNYKETALFKSPLYSGFGIGCRLRNENLAFNTFQLRLGIYPNIPNVATYRFAFGGEQILQLKDFDISAPEEIRFR